MLVKSVFEQCTWEGKGFAIPLNAKLMTNIEEERCCQDEQAISCQYACSALLWRHFQNLQREICGASSMQVQRVKNLEEIAKLAGQGGSQSSTGGNNTCCQ